MYFQIKYTVGNNTDLKLKSIGDGDILLKANKNLGGTGKIHLSGGVMILFGLIQLNIETIREVLTLSL